MSRKTYKSKGRKRPKFSDQWKKNMSKSAQKRIHYKGIQIEVICLNCNKKRYINPAGIKRNRNKFCSRICYSEWQSINKKGEKHWNWQGGISSINQEIRNSIEYKLWRKSVFERDNYTCIWCGNNESGSLNADHIKPFSLYPELRFAIDNGRTLCVDCHKTTDTWGGKIINYNKNI